MGMLDDTMALDPASFFQFVKAIRYGYRDSGGRLHFAGEEDFSAGVYSYSFSSPEEIVKNNCGLCWDLAEFIRAYCLRQGLPCRSYFMEYRSEELHQTHTQVFLYWQGQWMAAPDNCLGLAFGEPAFPALEPCVEWFVGMFTEFLQSVLKEKYDESKLLVREYTCTFPAGISDEEYLRRIRQ